MKNQTARLTRELLALYVRYGPEEFEAASRELREGNIGRLVASAADVVGDAASHLPAQSTRPYKSARVSHTRRSKQDLLVAYLDRLKASSNKIDMAVAQFAERILRREVLDSTAALRDFARMSGMRTPIRITDRHQQIRQIAEFLRGLSETDAREKMKSAEYFGRQSSSLQGWTDIIVKSHK